MNHADALGEFGIHEVAADARVTGFVALVLQPDVATIRAAYAEAAAALPRTAEQALGHGSLPHLTLTQCMVRGAPRARFAEYVARLDGLLRGLEVPLRRIARFGAGFLFWHVDGDSPARAILQAAHEDAIAVGEGLLDAVANAAIVEGTKKVTNDDPVLVAYARRYGYAFVRERYLPHVTLGFDATVAALPPRERTHTMTVTRVLLARLGPLGRVETVLAL